MPKYMNRLGTALALSMVAAACGGKGSANADSAAGKDLQPVPSAAAASASGDTSVANSPSSDRVLGRIPNGAAAVLHAESRVCTNTNKVGDELFAAVADPVHGSNNVAIPAGARVKMRITALKRSENVKDPIDMGFEIQTVAFDGRTYPMSATITKEQIERVRDEPKSKDVQKVVGGALVGAIAGKLIGKSTKGAVIGGAAGAAAGAGVAATTANYEGCIPQGSTILVTMTAPIDIR